MTKKEDLFSEVKPRKSNTPDADYFHNLSQNILDKQSKSIFTGRNTSIILAIAAVFILLFLVYPQSVSQEIELDPDLVLSYIEENIDDFSDELLLEEIESNETNDVQTEIAQPIDSISSEEIIDYLLEEELDNDELIF